MEDAVFCIECGEKIKSEETKLKKEKKMSWNGTGYWVKLAWVIIALGIIIFTILNFTSREYPIFSNLYSSIVSEEDRVELTNNYRVITSEDFNARNFTVDEVGLGDDLSTIDPNKIQSQDYNSVRTDKAIFSTSMKKTRRNSGDYKIRVHEIEIIDPKISSIFPNEESMYRILGVADSIDRDVAKALSSRGDQESGLSDTETEEVTRIKNEGGSSDDAKERVVDLRTPRTFIYEEEGLKITWWNNEVTVALYY